MIIESLKLRHFRNYISMEVEFSPWFNFISGPNGSGKTNILESISILSGIKSFRNVRDTDIIQWGCDSYYCCSTVGGSLNSLFEIGCALQLERIKKRAKIDGEEITSLTDYIGKLLTVVFSPSDINIINGSPDLRRRFFDNILSRVDREYLTALMDFKRVLQNRNRILKSSQPGITDPSELDVWDELFSLNASVLTRKRKEFIERFKPFFSAAFCGISGFCDIPEIDYTGSYVDYEPWSILKNLRERRKKDIRAGMTGTGPQRDDYPIKYTENSDFCATGSQGQKRAAAIALRLSECDILEELTGKRVIIMVDDIFSELDAEKRKNLFGVLHRENQVLFTMVEPPDSLSVPDVDVKRFCCENGVIRVLK